MNLVTKHSDIYICADCLMYTANGEEPEDARDWRREDCDAALDSLAADGLQFVNGDSDKDYEFSSAPCALCRSTLAGHRAHGALLETLTLPHVERAAFDSLVDAYKVCALWSSCGEDDRPLDSDYSPDDIADETAAEMTDDCAHFLLTVGDRFAAYCKAAPDLFSYPGFTAAAQFGHDFWLTRGAGFWDRGLGALGEELSELARKAGSRDLYVGDDGKIRQE